MKKSFDAIILGAGQAGPPLAGRLTAAGMSVALLERQAVGGTCVNTGCTPTKTWVASAAAAHLARRAADYGVVMSAPVTLDMPRVRARKDAVVGDARTGLERWLGGLERCTVFHGHARFESPKTVRVGDRVLSTERIFINVGGRAVIPKMPGVDRIRYLTNSSILQLDQVPEHLIVIGGSYIGLEFAQMFRRFGSRVTVIEKASRLIAREDHDVSDSIRAILEAEDIGIRTEAECIRFENKGASIMAEVQCTAGAPQILGSHVLLAVGRRPNNDNLGLDAAQIATDARGYILVDDELRTNVAGIWALGDCNGRGAFTHTAYNDFEIVAENLLNGAGRRVSERIDCYALFTDPPLGRAGMTEALARAADRQIRIGVRPMSRVSRAVEKGETQGFMKIIVDADSRAILGASILGVGGDEAIHCVLDVMASGAPYTTLQRTMHIHPTVSELIPTLLGELSE